MSELAMMIGLIGILSVVIIPSYMTAKKHVFDQRAEDFRLAHICRDGGTPALGNVGFTQENQKIICVKL